MSSLDAFQLQLDPNFRLGFFLILLKAPAAPLFGKHETERGEEMFSLCVGIFPDNVFT